MTIIKKNRCFSQKRNQTVWHQLHKFSDLIWWCRWAKWIAGSWGLHLHLYGIFASPDKSMGDHLGLELWWFFVAVFLGQKFTFFSRIWVKDGVILTLSHHGSGNFTLNEGYSWSLTTTVNCRHGIPGAKLKCSLGWPKWGFYFYWYPYKWVTKVKKKNLQVEL